MEAPLTLASLIDAPAPGGGSGRAAALQLAPDAMHQCRLGTGDLVLVAVCSAAPAAPSAAADRRAGPRTPLAAGSLAPRSSAPPAPTAAQLQEARPLDLWQLAGAPLGPSAPAASPLKGEPAQLPGRFYAAAQVWPAAKLPKGFAAVSGPLAAALGRPAAGSRLGVYRCTAAAARGAAGGGGAAEGCGRLHLRIWGDVSEAGLLVIEGDGTWQQQQQQQQQEQSAVGAAPGASSPVTPKRPAPRSSASAASTPAADAGAAPTRPGDPAAAAAEGWRRRLLASGLDWSSEGARRLAARLAARQLAGRWLLPGSVVPLPLLGLSLLCSAETLSSSSSSSSSSNRDSSGSSSSSSNRDSSGSSSSSSNQDSSGGPPSHGDARGSNDAVSAGLVPLLVSESTEVVILLPTDPPVSAEQEPEGAAAGRGVGVGAAASAAAGATAAAVAAARAAAEAAVSGSGRAAAAAAAERAVLSGAAASAAAAAGGSFAALGGTGGYRSALRDLVHLPLRAPELFARYRIRPPRGVLLHGPPGSGKTALARAAAADAGAALLVVNGPEVMSEFLGESEAGLQGVFAAARVLAPSVIFLDEVDALAPARGGSGGGAHGASVHAAAAGGGGGGGAQARVLTTLLTLMDGVGAGEDLSGDSNSNADSSDRVVVIGATNRRDALDPALRRPGRLERELEVGVPTPQERGEILDARLARVRHSLTPEQAARLAASAHGFVSADLAALVDEAALCALRRVVAARAPAGEGAGAGSGRRQEQQEVGGQQSVATGGEQQQGQQQQQQQQQQEQQQQQQHDEGALTVGWADFVAAQARIKPSALREVAVELPQVSWSDVGGLGPIKQRLREAVEWPQRHPDALRRLGARPPRGILLYGPPGCSKTLLARAVASEARLNFLSVKGGELLSKWVGGGERAVAALFARARAAAPAIVFFDELDGLAGSRPMDGGGGGDEGDGGGGPGERVLAQLLMEMDGLQPRLGVVVLAATNRPDRIDGALLRPGRFDRLLHVPPPDAGARAEIFRVHLRKTPLAGDVNPTALAARTEGYTGADVAAVCREAALAALDEDVEASEVAARHFEAAVARVPASAGAGAALEAVYRDFQRQGRLESL